MNVAESIKIAFISIWANKLRSFLTIISVTIGVFAIMGSGSLVDSIDDTITNELANLGENAFQISKLPPIQTGPRNWRKYRSRKNIDYSQYQNLKKKLNDRAIVSSESSRDNLTIKWEDNSTDPNVTLIGTDEVYFNINDRNVFEGRAVTELDVSFDRKVAVIGNDVKNKLFKNENPINKYITINNQKFLVVGLLDIKGAILGQSQDNQVIIPLPVFLKYYSSRRETLTLKVKAYSKDALPFIIDESIGIMRSYRGDEPGEDNSFEIETNESLSEQFSGLTGYLSYFGILIGIFSLAAAGVGITNIMLVAIKERTREIGLRKAVGAKKIWIVIQFLIETVTISQIGGIIGIGLGLIIANFVSYMIGLSIIIPINWMIISVIITTVLGISSGLYPAYKAANLDPIEALRYE